MPRIDAPTVAEHRAARERALLDAARGLLTDRPDRLPTLAEVGELAGLSRSSVYQYYASREDLLTAVVRDSFPRWQRKLDTAIAAADGPRGRILAYLRVNLELVAEGEHALARTLVSVAPSEELARRSQTFHDQLLVPLRGALDELGVPDPEPTTELLNGLVHTASRLVEQTGDLQRTYDATASLVDAYLRTLPGSPRA